MEEDIDYRGNDLRNSIVPNIETWRECSEHCAQRTGCEHWTHNEPNKKCHLKYSDSGRKSMLDVVSGKKGCKGKICYFFIHCHFSMEK